MPTITNAVHISICMDHMGIVRNELLGPHHRPTESEFAFLQIHASLRSTMLRVRTSL